MTTDGPWGNRPGGRIPARELARVRRAARQAGATYPGPVGEILARELRAYADFGYRFGDDSLLDQVTAELLDPPGLTTPIRRPAS